MCQAFCEKLTELYRLFPSRLYTNVTAASHAGLTRELGNVKLGAAKQNIIITFLKFLTDVQKSCYLHTF